MYKYKNTVYQAVSEPQLVVFNHREPVWEVDGYIEIEEWDELANMWVLYRGYGLVTEENPDPEYGETDINAVMEMVYENNRKRNLEAQGITEEPQETESDTTKQEDEKAKRVVADVENAVAKAKADEAADKQHAEDKESVEKAFIESEAKKKGTRKRA